jgi:hypothetical protein
MQLIFTTGRPEVVGLDATFGRVLVARQVQGEVAHDGEIVRGMPMTDAVVVAAEGDIQHPMHLVRDLPVIAGSVRACAGQVDGRPAQATEVVRVLWARPLPGYARHPIDSKLADHLARALGPEGGRLSRWLQRVAESDGPAASPLPTLPAEVLEGVLSQAAVEGGRPVAEFKAKLRAENARLDRECGPWRMNQSCGPRPGMNAGAPGRTRTSRLLGW